MEFIEEIVNRETRAWDTQNIDLLMSIFHPDMVWPWPPSASAHDPKNWVLEMGRFDSERWRRNWEELFATYELKHNRRTIICIEVSREGDGGFAVVDVDTLWISGAGVRFHWKGRACKIYTNIGNDWKLISQVGLLDYSRLEGQLPA